MPNAFLGAGNIAVNTLDQIPPPGALVSHARKEWENYSVSSLSPPNFLKTKEIVYFIKRDRPAASLGFLGEKSLWKAVVLRVMYPWGRCRGCWVGSQSPVVQLIWVFSAVGH